MSKATKVTVDAECDACRGTGLYQGFAEPKGTAVICDGCKGTGRVKLTYTPFTQRQPKKGVKWVTRSRGSFIATGVGPTGKRITYEEFEEGKLP